MVTKAPSPASSTSRHVKAAISDGRIAAMNSNVAITASKRPRRSASRLDSTPFPRGRGRFAVPDDGGEELNAHRLRLAAATASGRTPVLGKHSARGLADGRGLTADAGAEFDRTHRRLCRGELPSPITQVKKVEREALVRERPSVKPFLQAAQGTLVGAAGTCGSRPRRRPSERRHRYRRPCVFIRTTPSVSTPLQAQVAAWGVRIRTEPGAIVVPASVAHTTHPARVRAMPLRLRAVVAMQHAGGRRLTDRRVQPLLLDGVLKVEPLLDSSARRRVSSSGSRSAFSITGDVASGASGREARRPRDPPRFSRVFRIRSTWARATSAATRGSPSPSSWTERASGAAQAEPRCPAASAPVPPANPYGRKGVLQTPLPILLLWIGTRCRSDRHAAPL